MQPVSGSTLRKGTTCRHTLPSRVAVVTSARAGAMQTIRLFAVAQVRHFLFRGIKLGVRRFPETLGLRVP